MLNGLLQKALNIVLFIGHLGPPITTPLQKQIHREKKTIIFLHLCSYLPAVPDLTSW